MKTYEAFVKSKIDDLRNKKQSYIKVKIKTYLTEPENIELSDIHKAIKKYDVINKFTTEDTHLTEVIPDEGFVKLISELNNLLEEKIPLDIKFEITIINHQNANNLMEFKTGIPVGLRDLGVGYKIYKIIINKFGYITSDYSASDDAQNVWYNLMMDPDLYCYTSTIDSGVIIKSLPDSEIKEFLDKIKDKELIFDDELVEKVVQLYGSFENYKKPT